MILGDDSVDALVPLAAIFFIFGLPVIGWLIMRYLAHKERMEMIRHGFNPGGRSSKQAYEAWQEAPPPGPGPGWPDDQHAYGYGYPNISAQVALRKAVVIVAVGFALVIGLSFIGFDNGRFTPGPWLLGGLIPLFVGLAQVFSAMAAGATFRPFPPGPRYYPQPPPGAAPQPGDMPPPPGAAAQPPAGSYTYRPGATPELRPPSPPAPRE